MIEKVRCVTYERGGLEEREDLVTEEARMTLFINGEQVRQFVCSPGRMKELVLGHLFTEGYIRGEEDVAGWKMEPQRCEVTIFREVKLTQKKRVPMIPSAGEVLRLAEEILTRPSCFSQTGGMHSCAICGKEKVLVFAEDIGRYNAIDKAVGMAAGIKLDVADAWIYTSGRATEKTVQKAIACQVKLLVSRGAVTKEAIEAARSHGITLAGFARKDRMNIYTGEIPPEKKNACAVILTGGESRRMGRDKASVKIGEESVLDKIAKEFSKDFGQVLVSVAAVREECAWEQVCDIYQNRGPLGGLHAGMSGSGFDRVFLLGCDMPFVRSEPAVKLLELAEGHDAAALQIDGIVQPLFAAYHKRCLDRISDRLRSQYRSLRGLLERIDTRLVSPEELGLSDHEARILVWGFNTWRQYEELRARERA